MTVRQLTEIHVEELLGRFTHPIKFPKDDEFIILHGPNGVGKTMLLELIEALTYPLKLRVIFRIPFKSLTLSYSDGSTLKLEKSEQETLPLEKPFQQAVKRVSFSLNISGEPKDYTWTARMDPEDLSSPRIREHLSRFKNIEYLGPDLWEDASGDQVTTTELLERHTDLLPDRFLSPNSASRIPKEFRAFFHGNDVHLIETQRLLGLKAYSDPRLGRKMAPNATKVEYFARELSQKLADALADNSRTSQELDRTYPARLLQPLGEAPPSEEEIRDRYAQQSDLRKQLSAISLLDENTGAISIPEEMDPWQRNVLWTYLRDSEEKLSTFRYILERVGLLREIINNRFLFKRLDVDRARGFKLVSDDGRELPLNSLSSGEQHELVLLYDLLFNVNPGALVLIDEPEISLHVSWQKSFIDDLQRISGLVEFRTIVATHSPQVAGKWVYRMVSLTPDME